MWSWSASARWAARLPTRSPRVACGCSASTSQGTLTTLTSATNPRGDATFNSGSDMSNLLYNLAKLQAAKSISPPIIDFDRNTKRLQVVDSTFYFFLKHANLREIEAELPNPLEGVETIRRAEILSEFKPLDDDQG
jgi:hypothetical protein